MKNKFRKILVLFCGLTASFFVNAQSSPEWLRQFGAANSGVTPTAMARDGAGNLYVTGHLDSLNVDFDPGTGTATLSSTGGGDFFVASYTVAGNYRWAFNITGSTGNESGMGIALDDSAHVYVTGFFMNSLDFDPGVGNNTLVSLGAEDIFVASYDSTGSHRWSFGIGEAGTQKANAIAYDTLTHSVFITGTFVGAAVDFDPGIGSSVLTSTGVTDAFIAGYMGQNVMFALPISSLGANSGMGISTDNAGNIYCTGTFSGNFVEFNPQGLSTTLTSNTGSSDIFIAKYNPIGMCAGAIAIGGSTNNDEGHAITALSNGFVYVTGQFSGSAIEFNPLGTSTTLSSAAASDSAIFVARYNSSLDLTWAKKITPGGANSTSLAIASDTSSSVYFTGYYMGTAVDFNPGAGTTSFTSNGSTDMFAAKYDSSGNYVWAFGIGGTGADMASAITPNDAMKFNLCGNFKGTSIDFDPGSGTNAFSSTGNTDMFLARYNQALLGCNVSIATSALNVACHDSSTGKVIALASGGTAPYSYSWNSSPVQLNDTASGIPAGTYTVTVTDAIGCMQTASQAVTEPSAIAIALSQVAASCVGINNGKAIALASGGTGSNYAYSWNTTPVQTNDTATGLSSGFHTVTVTDSLGCKMQDSISVTTLGGVTVALSSTPLICSSVHNGTATALASGGTTPYLYVWNGTDSTATVDSLAFGYAYVVVTDSVGCQAHDSINVAILPPSFTIGTSVLDATCFGGTNGKAFAVASPGSDTIYTFTWNTSPAQNNDTATGLGAGIYTVMVTDTNGCSYSETATVGQASQVGVSTSSNNVSNACGNNGMVIATAGGGTGPYTYMWNTIPPVMDDTASSLVTGIYNVTVTDANNCTGTASVALGGNPPSFSLTSTFKNPKCFNDSNGFAAITMVTGGLGPYTYTWNTVPPQLNDSALNLPAGFYVVTVSDTGCSQTASFNIVEPDSLQAKLSIKPVSCKNGNDGRVFTDPIGGTTPYTYLWATASPNTADSIYNKTSGYYKITITDAQNCVRVDSIMLTQPATMLDATASMSNAICFGTATGTALGAASGGVPPYSYSWNTTPVTNTINAANVISGQYKLTVKDSAGCVVTDTITVGQPSKVEGIATIIDETCGQGNGMVTINPSGGAGGIYTYKWSIHNFQDTTINSISGLIAQVITAYVEDSSGCKDTVIATVANDNTGPIFTLSSDTTIVPGGTATLTVSGLGSISWTPATGLSDSTAATVTANPSYSVSYCVTLTNAGCQSTGCVDVAVEEPVCGDIFIPSAFSPNDDGSNETFRVRGGCLSEFTFTVYNRAGKIVFESNDQNVGWDGKVKDKSVKSEVFTWVLKCTNTKNGKPETITKTGNITLVK